MPSDYGYLDDDQTYADDGSGGPAPGGWVGPQAPRLTTLEYRPDRDGPFPDAGGFHASPFALDGASGNLLLGDGSASPYGPLDAPAHDPYGPGAGAPGLDLGAAPDGAPSLSDHIDAANALGQILQPAIGDALAAPPGMLTRDDVVDRAADVIGQAAAHPALSPDHYRDLVSRSIDALTELPDDEAGLRQGLSQLQTDHASTLDQLNAMAGGAGDSAGGWDAGAYPPALDFGGPNAAQDDTQTRGSGMDDNYGAARGGEAPTLPVSGAVQPGGPGTETLDPGARRPARGLVLSADGLDFIKTHEGFKPKVYNDIAGLPTIGYGHKIRPGESFSAGIGEGAAKSLLASDAQKAVSAVQTHVKRPLTQNQFDALVSFAYNAGVGAFESSTLLKKINAGDDQGAASEFGRWNKVHQNGKLVASKGLTDRRAAERALFER